MRKQSKSPLNTNPQSDIQKANYIQLLSCQPQRQWLEANITTLNITKSTFKIILNTDSFAATQKLIEYGFFILSSTSNRNCDSISRERECEIPIHGEISQISLHRHVLTILCSIRRAPRLQLRDSSEPQHYCVRGHKSKAISPHYHTRAQTPCVSLPAS